MGDLLLVVDVQNGLINEHSRGIVAPLRDYLRRWLESGRPVVATRFINYSGSKCETLLAWPRLLSSPEVDLASEIEDVIAPFVASGQAEVVDKSVYSALTPAVLALIQTTRATDIYICGLDTDACVLATAMDVFGDPNLRPLVLTDLCASSNGAQMHAAGLLIAASAIGHAQMITAAGPSS